MRAVAVLAAIDPAVPALYCSAPTPVDAVLEPLRFVPPPIRSLEFRDARVENRASGCTGY